MLRPPLLRTLFATASALTTAALLPAGALLNVTPQPTGSSTGASLPADPNAQPPTIPYLVLRLAPDTPGESDLSILEVTESGYALLSYPGGWTSDYGSNPTLGFRWHDGVMQPLYRSPAEQRPYQSMNYGYSFLLSINDSGVVVGSYSHEDTLDYYHSVSSDGVYVSTGCYWPAGESDSQPLPAPYPGLRGGYVANFITDTGTLHGRMLNRGVWPPHSFSAYITYEFGLTWSSTSSTPEMQGATWPAGDASTPQITRTVTAVSPSGLHTIGRESYQFFTEAGYWSRYENRFGANNLLDGLPLNVPHTPMAINDHGRWIATRSGTPFVYWSDDRQNLTALESAAPLAINNSHDILGRNGSVYFVWKWVADPANPPAYHYVKHKITPAIPTNWALYDINGRGFTTSGLFTGKIRKTHDDLGQPLPSNQQTTAPVLFMPVEMTWESLNANLVDENPNEGRGKRYFAGKLLPTETEPGNILSLKIKIPTQRGAQIKLRAFDVDDATPTSFDTAGVIDTNGDAGGDNQIDYLNTPKTGQFIQGTSLSDTVIVTLDENAEAVIQFKVGMQPGSNYRVVAALNSALGNFDQLQTATTGTLFVPAVGNQISGFTGSGALSPMLTVWRKLYIEQDSMAEVPTPRSYPDRAQLPSVLAWAVNDPMGRTTISEGSVHQVSEGYYNHGFIANEIDGQKFTVEHYYAAPQLRIIGLPTTQQQNATPWWIEDDDGLGLDTFATPILPRLNLITDSVIKKYKPAYIQLVDMDTLGLNPNKIVAFDNNLTEAEETFNTSSANSAEDLREYANDKAFWNQLVVAGHQGAENSDADPVNESAIEGISIANLFAPKFVVIYLEGIREAYNLGFASGNSGQVAKANKDFLVELDKVVAHEIGHSPDGEAGLSDHDEGGLMDSGYQLPDFAPKTIERFRKTDSWR